MPRARAILQSEFPYNISGRCINREWFQIPMDEVWEIFCTELRQIHNEEDLLIHSFVLMSNHFHLIASTPKANLSRCMMLFMRRASRRLTRAGNRINQSFSGRHFKCVLGDTSYFLNAYKYNYRNPVHAGICVEAEAYRYSTLSALINRTPLIIPLVEDTTLQFDVAGTLKWINTAPDLQKYEAVRYALKRPVFKPKKCPVTNRSLLEFGDVL